MKTKTTVLLAMSLAFGLTTSAMAQFGQPVRASDVLGGVIKDSTDQKLGSLKDMAIDLENGRVAEAVVAQGGFLGLDSKFMAVPPENFSVEDAGKTLRLDVAKEKLQGAPAVDFSRWNDAVAQSSLEHVYQYYDATPYFLVPEHQAHNAANPSFHHLGDVERASSLIGMQTLNHEDQRLGKVEDLIIDFSQGRVVEVIINSGRFLGVPDELSAVPPQALHYESDRDALMLVVTKSEMAVAPHFSSRAWPVIDRNQATDVYQVYHVVPYFLPIGANGAAPSASAAENPPGVNNSTVAPLDQGTSQSDLDITARIEKEIMASTDLSLSAKAIKVITVNGRVTLRGVVNSENEKRLLTEIASRVVPAANVDNQLEVKETAAAAAN